MSLLSRIFGKARDEHSAVRPLWHRVVELAREKGWYAECGIADTVAGRFDAITLVLGLVLLRMEAEAELAAPSVLLTELFVNDMDGQLREAGVGDLVVGKHMGRLMGTLGGRLGALRDALAKADDGDLTAAMARNITFVEGADPSSAAAAARSLATHLAGLPAERLLAGDIAR